MAIKAADQISIVDVTDAYSVILTSEAFTFVGGISGVATGATCSTQAVAFCGSNQCNVVQVTTADITCPTGISAEVTGSGTSSVTIKFTTTATISTACEAVIPVVVDGITVNKKFSFAVAKTGATGQTGAAGVSVTGITLYYLATSSATGVTSATTGWTDTIQTVTSSNKYLWTYQTITYSSGSPTNTTPVITGVWGNTGSTGATGVSITGVTLHYLATSSATGVTSATTGWTTTVQAVSASNKYLWTYQTITYSSGSPTNTTPVISGAYGDKGQTGAAGADAITVSITSSNGTVFKNNNGSTVLTAHVYKAGEEQTITNAGVCGSLGSIKWYVGTATTAAATSKTLTVSAADVTNVLSYTCKLEG